MGSSLVIHSFTPGPGAVAARIFCERARVAHTNSVLVPQVRHGALVTGAHPAEHAAAPAHTNSGRKGMVVNTNIPNIGEDNLENQQVGHA